LAIGLINCENIGLWGRKKISPDILRRSYWRLRDMGGSLVIPMEEAFLRLNDLTRFTEYHASLDNDNNASKNAYIP